MAPTIKDVAQKAGVSVTLVSRYINGKKGVGKENAAAIASAIELLQYRPNQLARALVQGTSHTLAVVVDSLEDPAIFPFIRGVELEARLSEYQPAFYTATGNPERKTELFNACAAGRADGVICYHSVGGARWPLRTSATPAVIVEGTAYGHPCPRVDVDYVRGGMELTKYMLTLRPWICLMLGTPGDPVAERIAEGYRRAVTEITNVDRIHQVECGSSQTDGYSSMKRLLGKNICPDGIITSSHAAAMGVMRALHEAGKQVPGDMPVAGFGGQETMGRLGYPALTTLTVPLQQMARQAVLQLVRQIEKGLPQERSLLVAPQLLVRESTRLSGI